MSHADRLRNAVRWMVDRKREEPQQPLWRLIDEASLRYDLTPGDAQFLLRNWQEVASGEGDEQVV